MIRTYEKLDFWSQVYIDLEDIMIGNEQKSFKSKWEDRYHWSEFGPWEHGLVVFANSWNRLQHAFKVAEYHNLKYDLIENRSMYDPWRFELKLYVPVEIDKPKEIIKPVIIEDVKRHRNGKKVLCIETNEIYNSCRDAALAVGQPQGRYNIAHACNNTRHTAYDLHWKYL